MTIDFVGWTKEGFTMWHSSIFLRIENINPYCSNMLLSIHELVCLVLFRFVPLLLKGIG